MGIVVGCPYCNWQGTVPSPAEFTDELAYEEALARHCDDAMDHGCGMGHPYEIEQEVDMRKTQRLIQRLRAKLASKEAEANGIMQVIIACRVVKEIILTRPRA